MISNNIYRGRSFRKAFGILALILSLAGSAAAATWTVDDSGGMDYTKIQDAIDNASAEDTIIVYNGTFFENVVVNKQLTLTGIGMPIINGGGTGKVINIWASNTNVSGFIIRGSGLGTYDAGIYVNADSLTIKNNYITANRDGIRLFNSNNNNITSNTLIDNYYFGIYLINSNNNQLVNNTAINDSYGISLQTSNNNNIISNNIFNNKIDGITFGSESIFQEKTNNNSIIKNTVYNNRIGILGILCESNLIINNTVFANRINGIYMDIGNNNTIIDNNISSNIVTGISMGGNTSDKIYHNNFLYNTINAKDFSGANEWNSGYYNGGNYWSDYTGVDIKSGSNQDKPGNDGIGDMPYYIIGGGTGAKDRYPFMQRNGWLDTISPTIIFASPTPTNNSEVEVNYVNVSILLNELGGVVHLFWNGDIEDMSGSGNSLFKNKTGLANGIYDYYVHATDTAGNSNTSENRRVTVNVTVPQPEGGSISGFKINDTNGNGKWDASEKGISNWTIRMIGIIGTGKDTKVIRKETFTDALGFYKFDNLPVGRYILKEKLKKGFVPTSSPVKRKKLAQFENSINNNFTNRPIHRIPNINVGDHEDMGYNIEESIGDYAGTDHRKVTKTP